MLPPTVISCIRSLAPRRARWLVFTRCRWSRTAWLSLVWYIVVAIGVPLPAPAAATMAKDTSQPFPCMFSQCGCRTAEECWRHCCCHTLAERLAWARENHVTPPDYVLAEAKAKGIAWILDDKHAEKTACCACGHCAKCAHCAEAAAATPSCEHCSQQKNSSPKSVPLAGQQAPADSSLPGTVVILKSLQCQGDATSWLLAGAALPPPAKPQIAAPAPIATSIVEGEFLISTAADPAVPPPRG